MGDLAQLAAAPAAVGTTALKVLLAMAALGLLILGYGFLQWERRQEDSKNAADTQVGLKLALYAVMLVSLGLAAGGLGQVLGYLISGAKGGSAVIKEGIAGFLAGGGGFAAVVLLFLPRTNSKEYPQVERYALGAVAALSSIVAVWSLSDFLTELFAGDGWQGKAYALAGFVVVSAVAALSLLRFGTMSDWVVPVKVRMPVLQSGGMQPGTMPAQGMPQGMQPGYPGPQPQGGYAQQPAPQQGGYPQQGQPYGGFPPQGGGGLPPPGGSGGGFPPQGGGGLPPPGGSGGGFPPQGGGGLPPSGGSGGGFPPR